MKKRILSFCILICFPCLGLLGCGEGTSENYFKTIKEPDNYRIEYRYDESEYVEIRVGNKVAFKTNNPDDVNHHSLSKNTEWTIYKNKFKENTYLAGLSQLAKTTYSFRQSLDKLEKNETTFLGRDALSYKKSDDRGVIEYIVDKEYNICLSTSYTLLEDGVKKTGLIVTLFEIGGQQLPDNPKLS